MRTFIWLAMTFAGVGLATTIIITPQQPLIERASIAAMRAEHRQASLDLMEAIAEGKSKEIILAATEEAGLRSYVQDQYAFDSSLTRCCALERIGATDLPEAEAYLSSLTKERIGPDETQSIFMKAQLHGRSCCFVGKRMHACRYYFWKSACCMVQVR